MLLKLLFCFVQIAVGYFVARIPSKSNLRLFSQTNLINYKLIDHEFPWELSIKSPCKINLFLRVVGRRSDGYHDLASLFQAISLSDNMKFSKLSNIASKDELICTNSELTIDDNNLVIKALNLMRTKTGITKYFRVLLDKKIPMQAGLGGGSGNAATTMYAFNKLCNFPASLSELIDWSGEIGSDVSFFFSSGTAYCTGRGEVIHDLPPVIDHNNTAVHLFKPSFGLSTPLVFRSLSLQQCLDGPIPESILDDFVTRGALVAAQLGRLINDLEPPAYQIAPQLSTLKTAIAEFEKQNAIAGSMMSGSGTTIFALSEKKERKSRPTTWHPSCMSLHVQEMVDGPDPLDQLRESVARQFPDVEYFRSSFIHRPDPTTAYQWYDDPMP